MTEEINALPGGIVTKDNIVNIDTVPLHMRADYIKRNENIRNGKELCKRCDGTGNELFSMYMRCHDCGGKGYVDETD